MFLDVGGPSLALGLAGAEDEDRLAVLLNDPADELVRRLDLEPLGAPAKLLTRRRIAAADQVDPERVGDLGRELVRVDRHLLLACRVSHAVQRGLDPPGDERLLDQGIRRDDVNRLRCVRRPAVFGWRARRAGAWRSSLCRRCSPRPREWRRRGRARGSLRTRLRRSWRGLIRRKTDWRGRDTSEVPLQLIASELEVNN